MSVNTKTVQGRRSVRFDTYDALLADAETMAGQETRTLGNWSLGQNLKHVAMVLNSSIDGVGFKLPAPVRWMMTLLMKRRFLTQTLPPGFKTTEDFTPAPTSTDEGLSALRDAIARVERKSTRAPHPAFGKLAKKDWDAFNLRHAETHLSFVVPEKK
jgi:hypothetical protein